MTKEMKLLQAAKDGDTTAFEQIVTKYQSLVCAITFSGTGRVDISEELAQETFLSAWKNLRQLTDPSGFRAWLCTIARNMLHNYYRKKKTVPLEPADIAGLSDQAPSPSDHLVTQEEHIMLEQALMQIPAEYREPLVMYYRQEKSTREVAVGLGLNESTVRTRLHRARQMLREEIAARLERTLEKTAPDKTFTKAVIAGIGVGLAAGVAGTASAAAAVTAGTAGTGTSAVTGIAAVMSTVTAKVITAAAIVAVTVGGALTYKHLSQPDSKPTQTDEIVVVSEEQELIPDESTESDSQETQEVAVNPIEVAEMKTAIVTPDLHKEANSKIEIETESSNADLASAANLDEKIGSQTTIKVVEKETGKPIADVDIRTYDRGSKNFKTDAKGICIVKAGLNGGTSINLFAAKDGYVGQSFSCGEGRFIDYFPKEVLFALDKGTVVGGIVHDPDGNPLEGATATFNRTDGLNDDKPGVDVRFSQKTDSQGRWHCTMAPENLEGCSVGASYPDYAPNSVSATKEGVAEQLRAQTYILTLDKGYSITGTVKDEAGNPIQGARVQLGDYYFNKDRQHRTHTDEKGLFDFTHLRLSGTDFTYDEIEGKGRVPVKYPTEYVTVTADDFAPQMMQVFFKEKDIAVEFVLDGGNPIYGRVVDSDGNPVSGATVRADNWERQPYEHINTIEWNTKTDTEGRFVWQHAPDVEIQLKITQNGYLDLETSKLSPSDTEYEFVLNPKVRVLGQVVDAVTQKPITEFTFRRHEGGYISSPKLIQNDEGRFETAFADQGETFTISFEAKGYKPTRSRKISLVEQDIELTIEMQSDAGVDGVIVDTDSKPLEGVRVLIPNNWLTVDNLKLRSNWLRKYPNSTTDAQGRFHLDPVANDTYSILVLEESGYLLVQSFDFPEDGRFVLQPYGRIEGTYYKGNQPVTNERIRIDYPRYQYINKGDGVTELGPAFNYYTQTDEQGKFTFDKLIQGTARILIDPYRQVEIKAGETKKIYIGGDDLTVQGYVLNPDGQSLNNDYGDCSLNIRKIYDSLPVPEDDLPFPEDADAMTYSELMGWFTKFSSSDEGRQWLQQIQQKYGDLTGDHSFDVDYNGRFEVPNVTPGTYLFTATVRPWENPDQFPRRPDYNTIIAQASTTFIVPEFDTVKDMDVPVDLGILQCRPTPLAVGMKAPDFDISKLKSSGRIKLSNYRGKTVLLNFSNPILKESEPDKAAMLELVCEKAAGRAAIINVAMEMIPWDYMRQKMIPECTLPGLYGVAQMHSSKIYADYSTNQTIPLPYSVLIDTDGTILWIGSPSEEMFVEID